jgi:hypothetical protein
MEFVKQRIPSFFIILQLTIYDFSVNKTSSAKQIFPFKRIDKFNTQSSSFFLIFVPFVNRTE